MSETGKTTLPVYDFSAEKRSDKAEPIDLQGGVCLVEGIHVVSYTHLDRLHNMRTGDAWPEQKRRDKARETMEVYAPIANRLGILNVKEELEDRSLHYLDPCLLYTS